MNEQEMKEWIKDNLKIEAHISDNYGTSNDIEIKLIFEGDIYSFSNVFIHIPEDNL